MTTAPAPQPPHHNKLTCYTNYRCRRPECVERYRAWNRRRDAAKRAGQWQPLVDADRVRQHLQMLNEHGITAHRVAEIVGVGHCSLHPLFQPQHGRRRPVRYAVRAETAAKILALTPEAVTSAHVHPIGTARRLQALVAIGWPMRYLGQHLDLGETYVHQLIKRSSKDHRVLATTALKVADGYERLKNERPARHGTAPRIIKMARNMAASRGWPPPKYWATRMDVIDDPDFTPEYKVTRGEILASEARWLVDTAGLNHDDVADRLGVSKEHLYQTLKRHPQSYAEAA